MQDIDEDHVRTFCPLRPRILAWLLLTLDKILNRGDSLTGSAVSPFRFSLQQVLNYREQLRDQAQVELARVMAQYQREEQRAADLRQLLDSEETRLFSIPPQESGERWLLEHFIRGLREDLAATLLRLKELARQVHEVKTLLAARAKEHKVLDKLKAKQAERHAHEERLQEQKTYDEASAIRFNIQPF